MFGLKKAKASAETPVSEFIAEPPTPLSENTQQLIREVASATAKQYKQELLARVEESLEATLRNYKAQVARCSWKAAQKWCQWGDDGPVLFPDNTRMYYRRGDTEVIVQEVPPHVRLMQFKASLLRNNSEQALTVEESNGIHYFSLALPYIVFLFCFKNGIMDKTLVSFCDRPLKNLKEKPIRPFLSNINSDLRLCHGLGWQASQLVKGDLTQQVAYTLDLFWQTVYSDEWSGHWWAYRSHFHENGDTRMQTLAAWQDASVENPLFVLEDVDWLQHTEANYGNIVVSMFDIDQKDNQFQNALYNDLCDSFVADVKGDLVKVFREAQESVNTDVLIKQFAPTTEEA